MIAIARHTGWSKQELYEMEPEELNDWGEGVAESLQKVRAAVNEARPSNARRRRKR